MTTRHPYYPKLSIMTAIAGLALPPAAMAQQSTSDAMPTTTQVISRGTLDEQNPQDTYEALKNVAGVTNGNSKGTIADNINIRGIALSFSTSYRLNGGLPIANISTIPTEDKERIEALKGANALMFGIASPAGIVNLVTKRAGARDVTSFAVSGNSFGQLGESVDIGRKFGTDKQFGMRVNLSHTHLETGVDGASGLSEFASLAADWKAGTRLNLKLDVETYRRAVVEQGQLTQLKAVGGVIAIPRVPNPSQLLSGPWAVYRPDTENVMLHADYALSQHWAAVAEAGTSESKRSRVISRISNYNLNTGQGTEGVTLVDTSYKNTYGKVEVLGTFATGPLLHRLTFGVMQNERDASVPSAKTVSFPQNFLTPVAVPSVNLSAPGGYLEQDSKDTGLYAYDSLALGTRWQFLAGLRETRYDADNQTATGGHAITRSNISSPAAGLVYQWTRDTSVYASFMKGLEETGIAPVGTTNQFSVLPPASATQKEIGVRASAGAASANLAYFDIERANTVIDRVSNTFLIDGTTRYRGVEATVNADLAAGLAVGAGGQLMHAVQNAVIDNSIRGLIPEGTPKVSGNVSLTWRPVTTPGLSLSANSVYTGRRAINPQNQGFIPGVALFSLGGGYATRYRGHGVALQVNVDNAANKRYWSSAGSAAYAVGIERSVKANLKFDM